MWTILQNKAIPDHLSPVEWFDKVLPRQHEAYASQYINARKVLGENAFHPQATFFAADDRGPVGIVVVTGTDRKRRLECIGVRGDRRRRGLGKALLEKAISAIQSQAVFSLVAPGVSSQNRGAVHLLESLGFRGQSGGGIRMRRALDDLLPPLEVPEGFMLRALEAGEEQAWVQMANAAFAEEPMEWTVEDFRRQFMEHPIFDFGRVFVALETEPDKIPDQRAAGHRLIGTASAWEANFGEGPVGLIHWVGVMPDFRRKGLGAALTVRALEELAARGYAEAWLNTSRRRAPAVRLYERLGFMVHREIYTYTLTLTP